MNEYVITYASGTGYCEYAGLSTWTKPTQGVAVGSFLLEVNTGNVYAFAGAEEDTPWVFQMCLQDA